MTILDLKDTRCNPNKLSMTPKFLVLKLSHGLVLIAWWAHPNYNIVLNCAGSPTLFLRQKLTDGKRISSSEFAKRPMCNIHRNEWRITQGMQPERSVLRLESYCYNKSGAIPMLSTSPRHDDWKPFLVVSDPCLSFVSGACISFTPN
jgi:hypothetical protein